MPYIRPKVFDDGLRALISSAQQLFQGSHKDLTMFLIDGASGCGKTRCGYELFRALRQWAGEQESPTAVGYYMLSGLSTTWTSLDDGVDLFSYLLSSLNDGPHQSKSTRVPHYLQEALIARILGLAD